MSKDIADEAELAHAQAEILSLSTTDYSEPNDECDIIMKGGITSGVVYPLTICKLATRYRLRSIGGTSAGAIAAVIAAAAEHRRQTSSGESGDGFRRLAKLPEDVSTRLPTLFQAIPSMRSLKQVLDAAINPDRTGFRKWFDVSRAIISAKIWWFVCGFLAAIAISLPGLIITTDFPINASDWLRITLGLALPAIFGVALGTLVATVGLALAAQRTLPSTRFGITNGATYDATPALTEWLADEIDAVSGITDRTECLTLGDLWGAEAVEAWSRSSHANQVGSAPSATIRRLRRVDLQVMTTNLTEHRPYQLPFNTQTFMFDESEMSELFPQRVVDKMKVKQSDARHPDTGALLWYFPGAGTPNTVVPAEQLPGPDALPLIVMARMSLSFPFLIGAVPLYAIDFNGDQTVTRMLFADGGVSSNFPMHFFDTLLPTRPTFGVNLAPIHPQHPETKVWRPAPTRGGIIPRSLPFETVTGYVAALRDTVQNWSDYKQLTQRGYADRVVEIRLSDKEGGMNLAMPRTLVLKLVARGARAGDELLTFEWDVHRVIRYRVAMARLSDALHQLRTAWTMNEGTLYPDHITQYPTTGTASSYVEGTQWRTTDRTATEALVKAIDAWEAAGWPAISKNWPHPSPEIRMTPE